ncbi:MAG TPA: ribonuclease P protein component [Gemmatimonadales bacterium]|nr:ribonuclease P protein component [Gemmatimonadales bacterium]
MTGDERFPRSRRLVRAADVRRVLQSGRRSRRSHLDILWAVGEMGHPRLGLVVPRFRQSAVARNRLRRRLKELWRRECQAVLPALDAVIRARPESYRASFAELRDDLLGWRDLVLGTGTP